MFRILLPVSLLLIAPWSLAETTEVSSAPVAQTNSATESKGAWPVPDLPSADMRLSWTDFRELLRLLQDVPREEVEEEAVQPPWPWSVSTVRYQLDARGGGSVEGWATFEIEVLQEVWSTIPILGTDVALTDILLDGQVAHLQREGEWHALFTKEPGLHRLEVGFYTPKQEQEGDVRISFQAAPASVTEVVLALGDDAAGVSAPQAGRVDMNRVEGGQRATLSLKSSDAVEVAWRRPSLMKEKAPPPPPRVTAHVSAQMRLDRELLESTTTVTFEVLRGSVSQFELGLPKELVLLSAEGTGLEWSLEQEAEGQRLVLSTNHGISGAYPVVLRYELPLESDTTDITLPRLVARDVARQDGVLGLSAPKNMDLSIVGETHGVSRVDPEGLFDQGLDWEVLHAFRFHQADYELALEIAYVRPLVVGRVAHMVQVTDSVIQVEAAIVYKVLRGETKHLALSVPAGYNVLSVVGVGMDWYPVESDEGRRIEMDLNEAIDATYEVKVRLEQNSTQQSDMVHVPALTLHDVARQSGWIAVTTEGNVKVEASKDMVGLQRIDETEVPATLRDMAQSPILHAFDYQAPGYSLSLQVEKLDDIAVRVAAIDRVELTSVLAESMLITRARYWVRNNQRQFLRVDPGPNVEIWGATVDGHVVSPAQDPESEHGVLLRMRKSREGTVGLGSFPMELIYMRKVAGYGGWRQTLAMHAPKTDVLADQVSWAVYLPEELEIGRSRGDLKPVVDWTPADGPDRGAMTIGPPESIRRLREGIERFLITDINNPAASAASQSKTFSNAVYGAAEDAGASSRLAGVLPVHINLPQVGVPHLFERVLLPQGDGLTLELRLASKNLRKVFNGVAVTIAVLAGFVLALRRHPALQRVSSRQQDGLVLALLLALAVLWIGGFSVTFAHQVYCLVGGFLTGLILRRFAGRFSQWQAEGVGA